MRCINKRFRRIFCLLPCLLFLCGCQKEVPQNRIAEYEQSIYTEDLYRSELFADTLCAAAEDIPNELIQEDASLHGAALFDVENKEVLYAYRMHERLFPASTTKILTALIAIERGNLDDIVRVSENAVNIPADSSRAWLLAGDQLTLRDLLYGLMLPSGNDAAIAIAEHIAGSVDSFTALMNEKARSLGATNSHFANPHGLEDPNHYTTAYDLYLILNACIKEETFLEIIGTPQYTASITDAGGTVRQAGWNQSNYYTAGRTAAPEQVEVIGGKTGTTDEAGSCLVLLSRNQAGNPYISIVMGAASKSVLYQDMTSILSAVPAS